MKEIVLSNGKLAIVDDEDYPYLCRYVWHENKNKSHTSSYAVRYYNDGTKMRVESIHRFVLDAPPSRSVDHRNGNGLDNRKANLRLCVHRENARNRKKSAHSSHNYKGVVFDRRKGRWRAAVWLMGKRTWGSYRPSEVEAARDYDRMARELHGEFARLNFA